MDLGKKPEDNVVMKKNKISKHEELKQLFKTMRETWKSLSQATHDSCHPKQSLYHMRATCVCIHSLCILAEPCSK